MTEKQKIYELKKLAAKERQRKRRDSLGIQTYAILSCTDCAWVFDRKQTGSNACPNCGSERTGSAYKQYGKRCYDFQFTQTAHKRMKQVKRLMEMAEKGKL